MENVLDNLPVLSEEAEDEDCAAIITCSDDVTSANVISCHVMIPNESSAFIGDINHKEVLVGSDSEDFLADQKPEELYSAELSSTGLNHCHTACSMLENHMFIGRNDSCFPFL